MSEGYAGQKMITRERQAESARHPLRSVVAFDVQPIARRTNYSPRVGYTVGWHFVIEAEVSAIGECGHVLATQRFDSTAVPWLVERFGHKRFRCWECEA